MDKGKEALAPGATDPVLCGLGRNRNQVKKQANMIVDMAIPKLRKAIAKLPKEITTNMKAKRLHFNLADTVVNDRGASTVADTGVKAWGTFSTGREASGARVATNEPKSETPRIG